MATTAKWGAFEWGAAEWGSIQETTENVAQGNLALNGSAALTGFPAGVATGSLALNGAAVGTNNITASATGRLELNGAAAGFQSRFVTRLKACGHPLITAVQDWLTK